MDKNIKYQIMKEIEDNVPIFKKVSNIRWRIRCPFCGDSSKDPRDSHMYLKCDYDNPNEPILYNCFLANCGAQGKVDKRFMAKLGIKSRVEYQLSNQRYSKLFALKETNVEILTGEPKLNSIQVKYIEKRLGKGLSYEDYDKFKIIWDMNTIIPYISDNKTRNTLPCIRDSISFLSDDKSTIISRGIEDEDGWRKIKILNTGNRIFYTIKTVFNLFTSDDITVNIAEGIFDIISVYKNFNDGENSAYIAILGSDYEGAVNYSIIKGLVGSNVTLKIYIDEEIDEKNLSKQLKKYKYFFKNIILIKNIKSKDVGVLRSNIELVYY